jgi:hypothetical protein
VRALLKRGERRKGVGRGAVKPRGAVKRVDGLRKLEEEAPFGNYAKAVQAEWAKRVHGGLRGEAGRHGRG